MPGWRSVGAMLVLIVGTLTLRAEPPRVALPRHYPHVRVAMLAYSGNPMESFERDLLRSSVDLVVAHDRYHDVIEKIAPRTPKLLYTNFSNLYLDLLTDWLEYADRHGHDREDAFYHVSKPTPFQGNSASSRPVDVFWSVLTEHAGRFTDHTSAARHVQGGRVPLPEHGSLLLGHVERFDRVQVTLASRASQGWTSVLEYPVETSARGEVTRWKRLSVIEDGTAGWTRPGAIRFHPPRDWKTVRVAGSAELFFVRARSSRDGGRPPIVMALRSRDYVSAGGGPKGTIPAFDWAADRNGDGYLDDAEWANRSEGCDARFRHESRLFYPYYGAMRFAVHPGPASVRAWAADYHQRLLKRFPKADALFVDNVGGKPPIGDAQPLESVRAFAQESAMLLATVRDAIAPRWLLANVAGRGSATETVVREAPVLLFEFALRPMAHHRGMFEDTAGLVEALRRLARPAPYLLLDTHPQGGSVTDPRTQLAALAYYHLLSDPDRTLLLPFGGVEPASSWQRHWYPAIAHDIGRPKAEWTVLAQGPDPAQPKLRFAVFQRPFEKALVLYKPLSYERGQGTGTLADTTATEHRLDGPYRPLKSDGTLGPRTQRIRLRNGEGAILLRD